MLSGKRHEKQGKRLTLRGLTVLAEIALLTTSCSSAPASEQARPNRIVVTTFKEKIDMYTKANGGKSIKAHEPDNTKAVVYNPLTRTLNVAFSSAGLQAAEAYELTCNNSVPGLFIGINVENLATKTDYLETKSGAVNEYCPDGLGKLAGSADPTLEQLGTFNLATLALKQ